MKGPFDDHVWQLKHTYGRRHFNACHHGHDALSHALRTRGPCIPIGNIPGLKHDHRDSRFQRDIDDVTGVSLSPTQESHSRTIYKALSRLVYNTSMLPKQTNLYLYLCFVYVRPCIIRSCFEKS